MADHIINLQEKEIQRLLDANRPPEEVRDRVDWAYQFADNTLELFEVRPYWKDPKAQTKSPIAKAKYNKSKNHWQIFWMRASGNWETYDPHPTAKNLEEFFAVVKEDKHVCFFG